MRRGKELPNLAPQYCEKASTEHQEENIEDKSLDGNVEKNEKDLSKDKTRVCDFHLNLPYPPKVKKNH